MWSKTRQACDLLSRRAIRLRGVLLQVSARCSFQTRDVVERRFAQLMNGPCAVIRFDPQGTAFFNNTGGTTASFRFARKCEIGDCRSWLGTLEQTRPLMPRTNSLALNQRRVLYRSKPARLLRVSATTGCFQTSTVGEHLAADKGVHRESLIDDNASDIWYVVESERCRRELPQRRTSVFVGGSMFMQRIIRSSCRDPSLPWFRDLIAALSRASPGGEDFL